MAHAVLLRRAIRCACCKLKPHSGPLPFGGGRTAARPSDRQTAVHMTTMDGRAPAAAHTPASLMRQQGTNFRSPPSYRCRNPGCRALLRTTRPFPKLPSIQGSPHSVAVKVLFGALTLAAPSLGQPGRIVCKRGTWVQQVQGPIPADWSREAGGQQPSPPKVPLGADGAEMLWPTCLRPISPNRQGAPTPTTGLLRRTVPWPSFGRKPAAASWGVGNVPIDTDPRPSDSVPHPASPSHLRVH